MNQLIEIAGIVLAPVVLFSVLRIDATLVFLSLCMGDVLYKFIGNDLSSFVNAFYPRSNSVGSSTIEIGLILLPAVLTAVVMIKSVKVTRIILNVLPSLCTGLLALLIIEPLMSAGTKGAIERTNFWQHLIQAQTLVVGLSGIVIIVLLWAQHRQRHGKAHKHRGRG